MYMHDKVLEEIAARALVHSLWRTLRLYLHQIETHDRTGSEHTLVFISDFTHWVQFMCSSNGSAVNAANKSAQYASTALVSMVQSGQCSLEESNEIMQELVSCSSFTESKANEIMEIHQHNAVYAQSHHRDHDVPPMLPLTRFALLSLNLDRYESMDYLHQMNKDRVDDLMALSVLLSTLSRMRMWNAPRYLTFEEELVHLVQGGVIGLPEMIVMSSNAELDPFAARVCLAVGESLGSGDCDLKKTMAYAYSAVTHTIVVRGHGDLAPMVDVTAATELLSAGTGGHDSDESSMLGTPVSLVSALVTDPERMIEVSESIYHDLEALQRVHYKH